MESTIKVYALNFKDVKTYLFAALFVVGNLILPQLCHFIPNGGHILLPIYFFTLIGAYKYGWKVGLLTAVLSPLLNFALFGMPPAPALPAILTKSVILALSAGFIAQRFKSVSLLHLTAVVLLYQIIGCLIESAIEGSLAMGFSDFATGIPGMLIQIVGGFLFVKYILKK